MLEQFLKFGVDIRIQPMEVAPTAHHIMGGLRITTECRTALPGLFACGEVAGGVQGANRLGGNALAETQVFGKRAGEFAGKAERKEIRIDPAQVDTAQRRLDKFFKGTENAGQVRKELKLAMWQGAGIFRNEKDIKKTLETINRLSQAALHAKSPQNLVDCAILQNMCLTASLICRCALLRPESRGAHVRVDINQEWDALHSPFSHTYISQHREGIQKMGGLL
jgi:fumarate reductase (CoM/CoB) subunit A